MVHILIGFVIILLTGCSVLTHKTHEYTGTWDVIKIRELWMLCYQKGMYQQGYPPAVAGSCDCYINSIRSNFEQEFLEVSSNLKRSNPKLKKMAAECVLKFRANQSTT